MKEISKALVKFQSELKPAGKDAVNPFFKSNYLTLSGIIDHVMPLLSSNGLAIIQPMKIQDGLTVLITRLIHVSGEFIESEMILPGHNDPQKHGSLITYYKRYQLQALLGISTSEEDDDGNSASNQKPVEQKSKTYTVAKPTGQLASQKQIEVLKKFFPGNEITWETLTSEKAKAMFDEVNNKSKK